MAESSLKFGVITDIHYGNGDRIEEKNDLHACFDFWRKSRVAFVVQLGDLIDGKGPEAVENLVGATAVLREYPGRLYHVAGNHCLGAPLDRYLEETGLDAPYYTFSINGIRFIVLHGMDINPESKPETISDKARKNLLNHDPWANLYSGAVGEEQIHWLERQLDETRESGEQVILFCHFPLLKETSDKPHGLLWNHDEVTDVLRRYENIIACFTGHLHRSAYFKRYGIHFMTMAPFLKRNEPPHYSCGMIELDNASMTVYDQNLDKLHTLKID
ncbi:metallophosphoesterase [Prosthecochloris sp. SCSIO W1101]|uniref:metallophosphoesterase n=1 Tax=Prosthecochloris sp. SCSIO W1101 TaxID=2992242 RepID=UPI00223E676B|nr:metallophosphoesterase [Prosthecochloris sp. SCSIO W1101]UZJ41295.1 metallophosphoesterase [Prosthecochloris sp. SCSIO W1101]